MNWPKFLTGIFFSMLPRAYWSNWNYASTSDFRRSTILSGLIELAVSMWLVVARYKSFVLFRAHQLSFLAGTNEGTQLYMSGVITVEYLLQPLTIALAYCTVEGALRSVAAWTSGETYPVLLIKVIQILQERILRRQEKPTVIPDKVEQALDSWQGIRIASVLPKEGWRKSSTIAIGDELYEIEAIEQVTGPHKVAYVLRKKPKGAIIRGLYRYEISARDN